MRFLKGILVLTIIISLVGCTKAEENNNIDIILDIFKMNVINGDYKFAKNVYDKAKKNEKFILGINEVLKLKTEELEKASFDENKKSIEEYIMFLDEIGQVSFGEKLRRKLKDSLDISVVIPLSNFFKSTIKI